MIADFGMRIAELKIFGLKFEARNPNFGESVRRKSQVVSRKSQVV
jgi:hypothetical protein